MAKLDPFAAEIVKLVRNMSDEAILDLVRNQLGVVTATASPARAPKRKRPQRNALARQEALVAIEAAVNGSHGMSAGEIAAATAISKTRLSGLVKELKDAGRIHMAGERRFARYAGDENTAQAANMAARGNTA
jgi:hypothetical protein